MQARAHRHAPSASSPSFATIDPQSFGLCDIPQTHYYEHAPNGDRRVPYFATGTGTVSCTIIKNDVVWVSTDEDGKPALKRTNDYWYSKLIGHYIVYKKRKNYYLVVSFNKLHLLGTPQNEAIDLGENNVWGVFKADRYVSKPQGMLDTAFTAITFTGDKDLRHLKKISTTHLPPAYARAFDTYAQKNARRLSADA